MVNVNSSIELSLKHLKDQEFGKIPLCQNQAIQILAAPHIQSFNYCIGDGLNEAIKLIHPVRFELKNGDRVTLTLKDVVIEQPRLPSSAAESLDLNLYPKECIETGSSYKASMNAILDWSINGENKELITQNLGELPIMLKSDLCHLQKMSPSELVKHGELVNETGGYFIINGACRILRLLVANRRNYPIVLTRETWKQRAGGFTDKGVVIRCVQADQTTAQNILHLLNNGTAKLEFKINKEFFFVPLIMALKILMDYSDKLIYELMRRGKEEDSYFAEKIKVMLRELQKEKLLNQKHCKNYIGASFGCKLSTILPPFISNEEICDFIFDNYVLPHLPNCKSKFHTLCLMTRKLYAYNKGECLSESMDTVSMHEVQLPGHTYLQLLKEKLQIFLLQIRSYLTTKWNMENTNSKLTQDVVKRAAGKSFRLGNLFQSFIATGNLPSKTGCGLMQYSGLTVVFDHLNRMRDLSHLRAIHRGSYFVDMKTIGPRRLTGEGWGFICPVHTPDGAPCGLLNHLSYNCVVPCKRYNNTTHLIKILQSLGLISLDLNETHNCSEMLEVSVDGNFVGYLPKATAKKVEIQLRAFKVLEKIYKMTEIVLIEKGAYGGLYPGLFLFANEARMMRPVLHLEFKRVEMIGTFEQNFMNIAISPEDIQEGVHTHMETSKTTIFSNIGGLVPFSDCNPNPRNMYQCQMGKQTMGTPVHNWRSQSSNKLYRLQYPQVPLVRNRHYDKMNMEEFCMGFNAIIAVISYTGYDMEDAMIVNKCSMERGLAHGQVYKTEFVDLSLTNSNKYKRKSDIQKIFQRNPKEAKLEAFLDERGLPIPGAHLTEGSPYYCVYDIVMDNYKTTPYKGEDCVVDKCSIMAASMEPGVCQKVCITLRVQRNPIIGDKFASRSGQKGIMSRLYPTEDLPFSERGIMPDIIFNPHGIPSRMTAGKLIELMAGKAAAEFGKSFDSTPFEFNDENPAVDYFGKILEKAGFNYYGEDVLYCGTDGRKIEVDVFEGIIYYQRLRHMTADKFQVRSTGPMDLVTHQPVKGRKRGGAIRFGEMERDCLIAHGASYTLVDRLMDNSDAVTLWGCKKCQCLLTPNLKFASRMSKGAKKRRPECIVCKDNNCDGLMQLRLPFAFKLLVAEFASVGIKVSLSMQDADSIVDDNRMEQAIQHLEDKK